MKYRSRVVEIDAFQWTGDADQVEDPVWAVEAIRDGRIRIEGAGTESCHAVISTLEGDMRASRGDWIVRGLKGELYPVKPDIFALKYEPADPQGSPRLHVFRVTYHWRYKGDPREMGKLPDTATTVVAADAVDAIDKIRRHERASDLQLGGKPLVDIAVRSVEHMCSVDLL